MGSFIPQVVTENTAASAQVIDGSFKFVSASSNYLQHTNSSPGNLFTYTFSAWVKRAANATSGYYNLFGAGTGNVGDTTWIAIANDQISMSFNDGTFYVPSTGLLRDISAWYHIVAAIDTTQATSSNRVKLYVNGVEISYSSPTYPNQDTGYQMNGAFTHVIGARYRSSFDNHFDGYLTEINFIDGSALDPSYFGFTDPLTNIWRPKKYEGTFGTTGFYLPMDGDSPIGEDKSGNGNDWTPVNFGGHVSLDKATGGEPILRTVNGGNIASGGAKTFRKTYAVTVVNAGGNKYFLDGVNYTSTTIPLLRGGTYKFDQSDSTNSGHPLRFATAADAAGSTQYTDGVTQSGTPGSASAYTIITVPHDAPNTLYYYCTNHNGMGGATSNSTDETKTDLYASSLVLALPLVGSSADVSNQINGGSTTKTITANGNAAASSDTSNFYGGSFEFDGSGDYLETPNNTDFQFGTGDWTIEFWWNGSASGSYTAQATTLVSSTEAGTWRVGTRFNSGNRVYFASSNGSAFTDLSFDVNVNDGNWHHVAVVRSSGTIIPFVDGVNRTADLASGSVSDTQDMTTSNPVKIGYNQRDNAYITGYLSDFRIYKGVAKYTNNFIPPSSHPDLVPDTPSGSVHSTDFDNPLTGSVSFDGGTDRLSIADSADFDQPADFTLEYYVYFANHSGNQVPVGRGTGWITLQSVAGDLKIVRYGQSALASGYALGSDRWYHFALVRSGTTVTAFVDGVSVLSATDSTAVDISNALAIGSNDASGSDPLEGFVSNVRFIKGTALYTSNFTPPREPLTNVTNTKLLCCQSTESPTVGEVTPGTINANGNPTAITFNPIDNNIETVLGDASGYCTLNSASPIASGSFSDGNLKFTTGNADAIAVGTVAVSTGKWYWEITATTVSASVSPFAAIGIIGQPPASLTVDLRTPSNGYCYVSDGDKGNNNTKTAYGSTYETGDVIGVALDLNAGTLAFYKNNIGQGTAYSSLSGSFSPAIGDLAGAAGGAVLECNFGQKPFKFPPPKGFKALTLSNVSNIGSKAAYDPENYFNTVIWSGDNASPRTITALEFEPDFIWTKRRNSTASHLLYDSVRGFGETKHLHSDASDAEGSMNELNTNVAGFVSDNASNGFVLTAGTSNHDATNGSGNTYVAWCWKAGDNDEIITYTTKVVSDSGNKYRFDDFGTSAVTLELAEGQTYIFDQSDSSNSGHPIRFSTTSDGTHGGGSEFTTGVTVEGIPGSAGARTIITVPAGTATLHYYCSVHSGMGGQANTNTTKGYSNFAGSIQSKVSSNTDAGFSIVSYTGTGANATVGHGLNSPPEYVIVKNRDGGQNWAVGSDAVDNWGTILYLNNDQAKEPTGGSTYWNSTAPTSSVINIGTGANTNNNSANMIAYCFHSVEGYSKFGSYTGNASGSSPNADGPFVYLGFKPFFLMIKRFDSNFGGEWSMHDTTRSPNNPNRLVIAADLPNGEITQGGIDFLSNGFKIRDGAGWTNQSNGNYVYMAFAEAPSMNLYGAQATAR